MRLWSLGLTVAAGCSLIYNPSNIQPEIADSQHGDSRLPDSPADAEIDAPPGVLVVNGLSPATIDEGTGDGSSRALALVITGQNFGSDATVSIGATQTTDAGVGSASITTIGVPLIAADGTMMAIPIVAAVDPTLAEGSSVPLDVTVTQSGSGGTPMTIVTSGMLTLVGHDELTNTSVGSNKVALKSGTYSSIAYSGAITASDPTAPLILNAFASVQLASIDVSAAGQTGGPGAASGGASNVGGGGSGGGLVGGGGAGFTNAGGNGTGSGGPACGDRSLTTFGPPNRASGGGGGAQGALGQAAGVGGGGGGSVEIAAGGTLSITTVTSNAGSGGAAPTSLGEGGPGGGGAGGVVLLRSGVAVANGTTVAVGGGAAGGTNSGAGSPGRLRIDSPVLATFTLTANASSYYGPMFNPTSSNPPPLITGNPTPTFDLIGQHNSNFGVFITNPDTTITNVGSILTFSGTGIATVTLSTPLQRGTSRICATVENGLSSSEETETSNCVNVTYVGATQ